MFSQEIAILTKENHLQTRITDPIIMAMIPVLT